MNKDCNGCFGAAGDDCQKCQEEDEKSRKEETQELFEEVKHGKKWSEMTEQEINRLKQQQCMKCEYYSRWAGDGVNQATCEYITRVGHSRGCSPLECKQKGIFEPRRTQRRRKS